jgi:hypothetical protein
MTKISERKKRAGAARENQRAFVLVPLTQDRFAKVDAADAAEISNYRWYLQLKKSKYREYGYAARNGVSSDGRIVTIFMHRQILGLIGRSGVDVDHRNGDGLDNRRANLRLASRSMNARNKKIQGNKKSSIYKGVYPTGGGRWRAQIGKKNLGNFYHETDAAEAYNRAARDLFGEFACCNNTSDQNTATPELPLRLSRSRSRRFSN